MFRVKDNLLYEVRESLEMSGGELPACFRQVRDELIVFTSDRRQTVVRLIQFRVAGSYFPIATNRFDLPTLKIIILYAYRWQIELFFKYLKRTLNGLHLLNHSENGVEIQFYLLMTSAILLLKFKQDCQSWQEKILTLQGATEKNQANPSEWIKKISEVFYESWKISKNWLLIVKNSIAKVIDNETLTMLNSS